MAIATLDIPGGCEGEAFPDGSYVSLVRGVKVVTSWGDIPLPPAEVAAGGLGPIYPRRSPDGWRFAGQSHGLLGVTWEWATPPLGMPPVVGWRRINQTACGVNPVIYDAAGVLHISDCSVGSQGWRYVEDVTGRLVTGDETYADPARVIAEWTTHGDLTVGQSGYDCIALLGTRRYVLVTGPLPTSTLVIHFNRAGDRCAVSTWLPDLRVTRFLWFDLADLPRFPEQQIPGVPPIPPTPTLRKPEVTVDHWDMAHLRDGETFKVHDRENPDLGYVFEGFIQGGGIYYRITNAAGSGQTGAFRKVFPS